MTCMRIDGRLVGPGQPAMVIAEIGVNHDGSIDRALELVQYAADAGADAVKLQIFSADSLMNPLCSFAQYQRDNVSESDPKSMLHRHELAADELQQAVARIVELGMMPLATPFSPGDVDVIQQLKLPAVKIASPDLVNLVLLERAAATAKPLLISTGAATPQEIDETVEWLMKWQAAFVLMHCVSSYPTPATEAHLCWISELMKFGMPVGYSDHTTDLLAGALAVAAGACVIEKHLTWDRAAAGPDHSTSADPRQFAEYVRLIRSAQAYYGTPGKRVLEIERDVRTVSRQSLVLVRDVGAGEVIGAGDLTVQRPGTGITPADISAATGRTAKRALAKGTLLQWEMLTEAA